MSTRPKHKGRSRYKSHSHIVRDDEKFIVFAVLAVSLMAIGVVNLLLADIGTRRELLGAIEIILGIMVLIYGFLKLPNRTRKDRWRV